MEKHKVLLLSVSAGAGHVRAAQAIEAYAKQTAHIEALHIDVMDYVPKSFRKIYIDTYIKIVQKYPMIWGFIYKKTDKAKVTDPLQKLRRLIERINTKALSHVINDFSPDAIICTHFLPAELLMHKINNDNYQVPVWVQITDFDLHRMWVIPKMEGYFTANNEVAFRLQQNGISYQNIHETGIPIMPNFSEQLNKNDCLTSYGLSSNTPTLLLMGGGAGLGNLDEVAEYLLSQIEEIQLIVLAGKNERTLQALQKVASQYPHRLFPQGFTDKVEQLMACADLVITKPGGLTSSECLAMGLPMIIHAPIPGQEEHNADFLLEQGVALKAIDELGLVYRIKQLLNNPQQLLLMKQKAQQLGKPLAAQQVLDIVTQQLQSKP